MGVITLEGMTFEIILVIILCSYKLSVDIIEVSFRTPSYRLGIGT
jgi:hypothetical protein